MDQRETDLKEIKRMLLEKDSKAVYEKAYSFAGTYSRDEDILLLLCQIFEADWHQSHEDMARSFQGASNPVTSESLYKVALGEFEYLNWNDNYPLQRKCTWALADIGTPQAKEFLEQIKETANDTIAEFAAERLTEWDTEQRRKGQMLSSYERYGFTITLEKYSDSLKVLPTKGINYTGNLLEIRRVELLGEPLELVAVIDQYVLLYQVHQKETAEDAVSSQKLNSAAKDAAINPLRLSFLSTIYSCNWEEEEEEEEQQQRILALWMGKEAFAGIFREAVPAAAGQTQKDNRAQKVKIQWNADLDALGSETERETPSFYLNSLDFENLINERIECIMDITDFVLEQHNHIVNGRLDKLLVPKERIFPV